MTVRTRFWQPGDHCPTRSGPDADSPLQGASYQGISDSFLKVGDSLRAQARRLMDLLPSPAEGWLPPPRKRDCRRVAHHNQIKTDRSSRPRSRRKALRLGRLALSGDVHRRLGDPNLAPPHSLHVRLDFATVVLVQSEQMRLLQGHGHGELLSRDSGEQKEGVCLGLGVVAKICTRAAPGAPRCMSSSQRISLTGRARVGWGPRSHAQAACRAAAQPAGNPERRAAGQAAAACPAGLGSKSPPLAPRCVSASGRLLGATQPQRWRLCPHRGLGMKPQLQPFPSKCAHACRAREPEAPRPPPLRVAQGCPRAPPTQGCH